MKNLLFLAFFGAVIYFGFVQSSFKQDFLFNGEIYSHVKKVNGGEITNHFYTPNGEDPKIAHNAIQILELSEEIQKSQWDAQLKPILNGYNLKSVKKQDFELSGNFERGGMFFKSYAAPIQIDGEDHLILYLLVTEKKQKDDSTSQKTKIINKLKSIQSNFT